MGKFKDHTGKRYSRLSVVRRVKVDGARNAMWECRCDCGNITVVAGANLGRFTTSCGCAAIESAKALLAGNTYKRTHLMSRSPEYQSWSKMIQRCENPNNPKYRLYGARGIKVCDRWRTSFEAFFEDMGPKPPRQTIDRIDNDGNYQPDNCRWGTNKTQGRNRRQNRIIEIDGQRMCLIEWCEKLGVPLWKPREMIRNRGRNRDLPPTHPSIEAAVEAIYRGIA